MSLFGGCDCAADIASLRAENVALRAELDALTTEFGQSMTTTARQVIAHFEDVKRKEMQRRKEERAERVERLVLPAL